MLNEPLHIVFQFIGGGQWTGGTSYLENLFTALHSSDLAPEQRPEIILFVKPDTPSNDYGVLIPLIDKLLHYPGFNKSQSNEVGTLPAKSLEQAQREYRAKFAAFLYGHAVDVLVGEFVGMDFPIPTITWLPDFQQVRLPDMWSQDEITRRNKYFMHFSTHASRILLSSQDVRKDYEKFAPQFIDKGRVFSFVAQIPASLYDTDPAWVSSYYNLPLRFFFLPDQFWKHKNHEVVLEALIQVKKTHPDLVVVCAGNTNDFRDPLYFGKFLADISKENLRDNLIILGMVPHDHVFPLIRQSLAMLQPSLFEGWSTTVEEARSIGKQMILSDLPIHREQNPPQSVFFDPIDPDALAKCLIDVYKTTAPGPDYHLETLAREIYPKRTTAYARQFMNIVRELVPVK